MESVEQISPLIAPSATQAIPHVGHSLALEQIMHRFGAMVALQNINLNIKPGEFVSLLGPSGCGKTTLLRIISGFLTPTSGQIRIDGQPVSALPPNQRGVGIVFQNYALFPHMSVWDNIAYGLRAKGTARGRVSNKVGEMLELVQLGHLAKRYPSELSGGQQQRVAIARALAVEPKLMLLDEPFSALDKNLRLDMQIEIRRLLTEQGVTAILVTHDQEEAMSMSDRIAVMSQGEIHQFGSPSQIYDQPSTLFVSTFVGTCNLLPAQVIEQDSASHLIQVLGGGRLLLAKDISLPSDRHILIAVRPENFRVQSEPSSHCIPGTVEICLPLGAVMTYEIRIAPDTKVKVTQPRIPGVAPLALGETIYLELASSRACSLFPANR
ncbi:ABC transporter ATP-binding protein [filamentous cyanobacterium CCP2]|nr:ABC transporter ATP-binding protein [filamentous cyanobacterium CCP2]